MNTNEFTCIIDATKATVLAAIERYLDPQFSEAIDDVVQETYIRAYKSLIKKKFKGESALTTYLYAIARNEARRLNKKQNKESAKKIRILQQSQINDSANLQYGSKEKEETCFDLFNFRILVQKLPEKYASVLYMLISGFSQKEIAAHLKINPGTVKSRSARGREMLIRLKNQEQ